MATNEFLPFANAVGSNVESQAQYQADSSRTAGNQPGIASSALNNKALKQSSLISSQVAQLASDITGANMADPTDGTTTAILQTLRAALQAFAPQVTKYTSGSGSHALTYIFLIASGSATAGATYTNNAVTFTVQETVSSGTVLRAKGTGAPAASGTLTYASGTGDATITFYAVKTPIYFQVEMCGPGGGGGGGSTFAASNGGNGNNGSADTTFGTCTAAKGLGGSGGNGSTQAPAGGSATLGSGYKGVAVSGGSGSRYVAAQTGVNVYSGGGNGGSNPFGGSGAGGAPAAGSGSAGAANTGAGGGGGGNGGTDGVGGAGGSAGGYIRAILNNPSGSYSYAIGTGGSGGSAGTSGGAGAAGADGVIIVSEYYQ